MVGAGRFERPTPCAQGRCATRLRYAPTLPSILNYTRIVAEGSGEAQREPPRYIAAVSLTT